jgi:hypothetical protein
MVYSSIVYGPWSIVYRPSSLVHGLSSIASLSYL